MVKTLNKCFLAIALISPEMTYPRFQAYFLRLN